MRDPQARAVFRDRGHGDVGALGHRVLAHEQAEEHVEGVHIQYFVVSFFAFLVWGVLCVSADRKTRMQTGGTQRS